jgi:hypothetical protein
VSEYPTTQGPIRRFVDSEIQESITRAVAAIPEGRRLAVIPYLDKTGVRAAVVGRAGSHLQWTVVAHYAWGGRLDWQAGAIFSL